MRRSGINSLLILVLCCLLWSSIEVHGWMLYIAQYRQCAMGPKASKKLFEIPDSTALSSVGRYGKGVVGWITDTVSGRCAIHNSRCRVIKRAVNEAAATTTTLVVSACSGGGASPPPEQNQSSITLKRRSSPNVTVRKRTSQQVPTARRRPDIKLSTNGAIPPSRKHRNSTNEQVRKEARGGGMATTTPRKLNKYVKVRPAENRGAVEEDCQFKNKGNISVSVPPNHQIPSNGVKKGRRRRTGKLKERSQENSRKEMGPFVWDPKEKLVSIAYNRNAKDVFSWISLSTHRYGPMLDRKTASSTTHGERMDWLKSWVFASDRHGVLPANLALVLEDHVGYCNSNSNNNNNSGVHRKTFENKEIQGLCLWPGADGERDKKKREDECSSSSLAQTSSSDMALERDEISEDGVTADDDNEDLAEDLIEEKMVFPTNLKGSSSSSSSSSSSRRSSTRVKAAVTTSDETSSDELEPGGKREGLLLDGEEEPSVVVNAKLESESLGSLLYDAVRERLKTRHPRVIVVGDVHGCINELKELIRRVEYHPGDLLVFLGDLMCKGPDSHAVVTLARELGAVTVRGNHEYEVLRQYQLHTKGAGQDPPTKSSEHYWISQNLSIENAEWLQASPWYMKSIDLDALFVHAGLIQGVQLRKQNPRLMMNMRSILPDGTVTSKHYGEWPWARMWEGPQTVFFGHDAQRGLQIHEHGIGLDTGCVYGKRLTACVLPERQIVSVVCCKPYRTFKVSKTKQQQQQTGPQKK